MTCGPNFMFSVNEDKLLVIEADGEHTVPLAGQHYSAVLTAGQAV